MNAEGYRPSGSITIGHNNTNYNRSHSGQYRRALSPRGAWRRLATLEPRAQVRVGRSEEVGALRWRRRRRRPSGNLLPRLAGGRPTKRTGGRRPMPTPTPTPTPSQASAGATLRLRASHTRSPLGAPASPMITQRPIMTLFSGRRLADALRLATRPPRRRHADHQRWWAEPPAEAAEWPPTRRGQKRKRKFKFKRKPRGRKPQQVIYGGRKRARPVACVCSSSCPTRRTRLSSTRGRR